MHKALLTVSLLAALAFAGCGDKGEADLQPVTCPDGTVMSTEDLEAMPEHHAEGFNATDHCPVKPSVTLSGVPASLTAFKKGPFSWTLDNGSVHHAHSMLTSIRYSTTSVPDADLTAVTKYPSELIKREHQDLPITYKGNLTFNKVGMVYLRAYMEVAGVDYWSPEIAIDVTEVAPTGKTVTFVIPPATGVAGEITPAEQIVVLGDAITVDNQDVAARKCEWQSGPVATEPVGDAEGAQASLVMKAPGTYEYKCDTLQARTFKVIVNA